MAEAWYHEKSGEAAGESAASAVVDSPGLKWSCREVEACCHEERLEEAMNESTAQLQQKTPTFWGC